MKPKNPAKEKIKEKASIKQHKPKSVVIADGIVGCPHEEGIDYPKGERCPKCPFWSYRDKWSGEPIS